jgi:hypothetical protein
MTPRICAGGLIVFGIISLIVHLRAGALVVVMGAALLVISDNQRKRKRKNA